MLILTGGIILDSPEAGVFGGFSGNLFRPLLDSGIARNA